MEFFEVGVDMSGEWIKMRVDLSDDPAVFRLASLLECNRFCVVGQLHAFWSWVSRHSVDGHVDGANFSLVDEIVNREGFADALFSIGWISRTESGIEVPKFSRHNGSSGKTREQKNARQARWRAGKEVPDADLFSTNCVDAHVDGKTSTREEKRREDKPNTEEAFSIFWNAYPRKDSKVPAKKAFEKLSPDAALLDRLMTALEWFKQSDQWCKDDGTYIHYASTWLNKRLFEDVDGETLNSANQFADAL